MNPSPSTVAKIVDLTGDAPVMFTRPLISDMPTDEQLFGVYQALRGERRRAFFRQHSDALMRALREVTRIT